MQIVKKVISFEKKNNIFLEVKLFISLITHNTVLQYK